MKVNCISFGEKFNTNNIQNTKQNASIDPFLYVNSSGNKKRDINVAPFSILTVSLAALAVGVTLFNLKGRKTLSDSIVNLEGVDVGLNKIKKFQKTVDELKSRILYPIKSSLLGDDFPAKSNKFKSGLILSSNDRKSTIDVMSAFMEHTEKLGIKCLSVDEQLKRSDKIKWIYKQISIAKKNYINNNQYTVINIGDIGSLSEMKNKTTKSKIEILLSKINSKKYAGVVWTAWTDTPTKIPYFYNNLPILITKLLN